MSADPPDSQSVSSEPPGVLFAEFLEGIAPSAAREVSDLREQRQGHWILNTPDVQLHCDSESCGGIRFFRYTGKMVYFGTEKVMEVFLRYECRNCEEREKIYAVVGIRDETGKAEGSALKLGEWPVFGPPTPPRLVSLAFARVRVPNHSPGSRGLLPRRPPFWD